MADRSVEPGTHHAAAAHDFGGQSALASSLPWEDHAFLAILQQRFLDAATLHSAARLAERWHAPIARVLVDLGWISPDDYAAALAEFLGVGLLRGRRVTVRPAFEASSPDRVLAVEAGVPRIVIDAIAYSPADLHAGLDAGHLRHETTLLATSRELLQLRVTPLRPDLLDGAIHGLERQDASLSARIALLPWQLWLLAAVIALTTASAVLWPRATVAIALLVLTLPFLAASLLRFVALRAVVARPADPGGHNPSVRLPDSALPSYTVMVPLYDEVTVLPDLMRALLALDYPTSRLEIFLILEERDTATRSAVEQLELPGHFRVIVVPPGGPRTKPKALNYVLGLARGKYVVVYDAEDRPEPDQLQIAAAKFRAAGPRLACVQARLNVFNSRESFLSRQFTLEYTALFDALLPCLERLGIPIPLGGTSNHLDAGVLRGLGGWDPFNVTEDADLGIRLARFGMHTATIDSTTWEEAPATWSNWKPQRTRWLKGWMQTYLVHMRHPLRLYRELGGRGFLGFQLLMTAMLLSVLVHPWVYVVGLYDLALSAALPASHSMIDAVLFWGAAGNFVLGFGATMWLGAAAARRRGWPDLARNVWGMPIYWMLISYAGYRALAQLVTQPHHWEKTQHGGAQVTEAPDSQT
ncbi:MAG: glycosyltransferase [Hyphomicrobiaceae bacterium]